METFTILVVEDEEVNRKLLEKILSQKYQVLMAENGQEAVDLLENPHASKIDLILLDIVMPVMNGADFLKWRREKPKYREIPVIITTSSRDTAIEAGSLELGADDFVTKPYKREILLKRIENLLSKYVMQKREMEEKISRTSEELQYRDKWDVLTGLYNRSYFYETASKTLKSNPNVDFMVAVWDIDHFKVINEMFGNEIGDRVLKRVAEILVKHIPQNIGVYGRLEADHFALCAPISLYRQCKDDFLYIISHGMQGDVVDYPILAHVGVYKVVDHEEAVSTMCDRAKLAIDAIKTDALERYCYYEAEMSRQLFLEQELLNEFKTGIKENQFYIQLQPIVDTVAGDVISAEALVRWNHPTKGFISPGDFIPVFEKTGFVTELDYYVWDKVCAFLAENEQNGIENVPISINISRKNFVKNQIHEKLMGLLDKYHLRPNLLKLEVTESAYMDHPEEMLATIVSLQKDGFLILMDDFGSGFSSLNMLKNVPVDILKIDMEFVRELEHSERGSDILYSVVDMTKRIKMQTVAEGVETKRQFLLLKKMGCDSIQGYYFSKPLLPDDFRKFVSENKSKELLKHELEKDKKTILVVDDDEMVLTLAKKSLSSDYNVLVAENGKIAYDLLERYKTEISFVVSDMIMPEMGGKELINAMKENTNLKNIPIVILTAEGNSKMAVDAIKAGAIDIISKPMDPRVLKVRINNIIGSRSEDEFLSYGLNKELRNLNLLQNINAGICELVSYAGQPIQAENYNLGFQNLFGYSDEEFTVRIKKNIYFGVLPEDKEKVQNYINGLFEGTGKQMIRYHVINHDNEKCEVAATGHLVEETDVKRVYLSLMDISDI